MMKYKMIDLCAGIGGIRRGFELTGCFKNVLSAEVDPYAAKTYKHLFGTDPTNNVKDDVFKLMVSKTKYDVLLAGFPCQAFSSAGKQEGFKDLTRGTIFFDIADIIETTRPKALLLENVENLLSHDKGKTIETIIRVLDNELDYKIVGLEKDSEGNYRGLSKALLRNSKEFGVPQNRPRVYIMAFDRRRYKNKLSKINDILPVDNGSPQVSVESILEKKVDIKYYMSSEYWNTLKQHKERQKEKGNGFGYYIINQGERKPHIANTIMATGGSGKERNLVYQPRKEYAGKTISTKRSSINSDGIRVMTPIEWGRLQGFIGYGFIENGMDTFCFPEGISDQQKYKQFGNSVTIPVIETMAYYMLDCFRKMK